MKNSSFTTKTQTVAASYFEGRIETEAYIQVTVTGNPNSKEIEQIFAETGADVIAF